MLAIGIFFGLCGLEVVMYATETRNRERWGQNTPRIRITLFLLFVLLVTVRIIPWGFAWYGLGALLAIRALISLLALFRRTSPKAQKKGNAVRNLVGGTMLFGLAVIPLLLFPRSTPLQRTASNAVGTMVYTWIDESREDSFTAESDYRKVTVQFWYPALTAEENAPVLEGPFPLVVFSHGAFGYRMSNHSTFMELAGNGYIVASIDHTHQAFMTKEADGTVILGDSGFIRTAMDVENGKITGEELYHLQKDWMALRSSDMAFVLDQIRKQVALPTSNEVFHQLDIERIGVLGHSMGGATAAWIGREDDAIDAVIVLDGTLMGEIVGFEQGKEVVTDVPYPKPILDVFNESHYEDAKSIGLDYANMRMQEHASKAFQLVVNGSGHLNFTDLPLVSPLLASLLGTGSVDPRYCMEITNAAVREFLDYHLKGEGTESLPFRRV